MQQRSDSYFGRMPIVIGVALALSMAGHALGQDDGLPRRPPNLVNQLQDAAPELPAAAAKAVARALRADSTASSTTTVTATGRGTGSGACRSSSRRQVPR